MKTPPFYTMIFGTSYFYPGTRSGIWTMAGRSASAVKKPPLGLLLYEARPWHDAYDPNEKRVPNEQPWLMNELCCDVHVERKPYRRIWDDGVESFQ